MTKKCVQRCRGLADIALFDCTALHFVQVQLVQWSVAIHGGFTQFAPSAVSDSPHRSSRRRYCSDCVSTSYASSTVDTSGWGLDFSHFCPQRDSRPSVHACNRWHLSNARRIEPPSRCLVPRSAGCEAPAIFVIWICRLA